MESITFQGEAFSEYYCTRLLWSDPHLAAETDHLGAEQLYKKASSAIRFAQRQLRDREQARSTYTLLLNPLTELLGWRLGETNRIVTELEQEEEGRPLLDGEDNRVVSRAICIAPDAHLDAAPAGLHRRFAPRSHWPACYAKTTSTTESYSTASSCGWFASLGHHPHTLGLI